MRHPCFRKLLRLLVGNAIGTVKRAHFVRVLTKASATGRPNTTEPDNDTRECGITLGFTNLTWAESYPYNAKQFREEGGFVLAAGGGRVRNAEG